MHSGLAMLLGQQMYMLEKPELYSYEEFVEDMAYADYGGYAYCNGKRVVERSDCPLHPSVFGLHETDWQVWSMSIGTDPQYHVLLGDGKISVGLLKSSTISIRRQHMEVPLLDCWVDLIPEAIAEVKNEYTKSKIEVLDTDWYSKKGQKCSFEVDGYRIEVYWLTEYGKPYQYVRMFQPNGNVWTGFSGYEVGEGFDEYGTTAARVIRLEQLLGENVA